MVFFVSFTFSSKHRFTFRSRCSVKRLKSRLHLIESIISISQNLRTWFCCWSTSVTSLSHFCCFYKKNVWCEIWTLNDGEWVEVVPVNSSDNHLSDLSVEIFYFFLWLVELRDSIEWDGFGFHLLMRGAVCFSSILHTVEIGWNRFEGKR